MASKISIATQTEEPAPAEKKTFFIPTDVSVRYTLEFSGQVQRLSEYKDVRSRHIDEARDELLKPSTWSEFLAWTIRDAVMEKFQNDTGREVFCGANDKGPVENLRITLDPKRKKTALDEDFHTYITGRVSWDSIDTDSASYKKAAAWRLGDRMAHHGVQDYNGKWVFVLEPGETTKALLASE